MIGATAPATAGVAVSITVRSVTTQAGVPGEIAGPGMVVDVRVRNTTKAALDTSLMVINATDGQGRPGVPQDTGSTPISPTVKPGGTATGSYVVRLQQKASQVHVTVQVAPQLPEVVFTGPLK